MNYVPKMNRRSFVVGTAAAGAGLAIGFDLPLGPQAAALRPQRRSSAPGS